MEPYSHPKRENRFSLEGLVRYRQEKPDDDGVASWVDVSRTGAAIRLGRFFRPGRSITIEIESPLAFRLDIRARVIWCTGSAATGVYRAGLDIYRDNPEAALHFATLSHGARRMNNPVSTMVNREPVWKRFSNRIDHEERIGRVQAQAV